MTTSQETLGVAPYEWNDSQVPPRLVRRNPRIERRSWPYRVVGIAAGAAYFITSIRAHMPLLLFGGLGEVAVLWMVSERSLSIDINRGRQWVAREIAFATTTAAPEYRTAGAPELVVDGERVGTPTAVLFIRSTDYDHFTRRQSIKYEVAIATRDRVIVVDEGPWEEEVRALAQHIVRSLGSKVPLIERTAKGRLSLEPLWIATFIPALAVVLDMAPARRGLVAVAVLIAIFADVVAINVRAGARARDLLLTTYGVAAPAFRGPRLPFRYALAFAIVTHGLFWVSILGPGGPHIAPR